MNKTIKTSLAALGCLLMLGATAAANPTSRVETLLNALQSDDRSVLLSARHQILNERDEIIDGLVRIAAQPTRHPDPADWDSLVRRSMGSKCYAIELLGELRADDEKTIAMLYENLDYGVIPAYGGIDYAASPDNRFPAVGSLADIGTPALERALEEMASSEKPLRRELCTVIAMRVLGRDQANARITEVLEGPLYTGRVIHPEIKQRRANLEAARELLESRNWPRAIPLNEGANNIGPGPSGTDLSPGPVHVPEPTPRVTTLLDALQSDDRSVLLPARHQILNERRELIKGLIEIAAQPTRHPDSLEKRWHGSKHQAIELLGELRADNKEAVRALYENLDYEVKVLEGGLDRTNALEYRYPAVHSLARIGVPALERAFDEMAGSEDPLRRELCTVIAMRVLGRDHAKARVTEVLKGRLYTGRATLPAIERSRANLEAARGLLERSDWP